MDIVDIIGLGSSEAVEIKSEDCSEPIEIKSEDCSEAVEIKSEDCSEATEIKLEDCSEAVEIKSEDCSEALEVKLEKVDPDTENGTEQTSNFSLKCEESNKITSEGLNEYDSKSDSYFLGDEDIKDCGENEPKFNYLCNIIHDSIDVIDIKETAVKSDPESEPENGVKNGPVSNSHGELTGGINNKNVQISQVNGKPAQKTAILWNESLTDGENSTLNKNKNFSNPRFSHRDKLPAQPVKAPLECPRCPKITTNLDGPACSCHTKRENINWAYCGDCDFKTKRRNYLKHHINSKHTEPSLYDFKECKECGKKFRKDQLLTNHMKRIHYPEKKKWFKCDYCSHTTSRKFSLKTHMSLHVPNEKGFKCSKCDFSGKNIREMLSHRAQHREWMLCHLCTYKTKNLARFKLHQIHHREKKTEKDLKFKCEMCDYKTYRGYDFTLHRLKHKTSEETEMFQCYHCKFKSKRKDGLKTHIFQHDIYKNILDCFICSFKTRSKCKFKRHVDTHSEEQRKEAELKLSAKKKTIKTKKDS